MNKSTLTSKGRLTIPKEVRGLLNLKPGNKFSFEVEGDDTVRLKVQRRKTLGELRGSLSSKHAYPGKKAERAAAKESIASFDRNLRKLGVEFMEPG